MRVTEAVTQQPLIAVCLLRHPSVHETLDPVADELRGRTLVNLTTTTPNEAREMAAWAAEHGIRYLDGAVLAVPAMIGTREAQIFYSGSRAAYEEHEDLLGTWATSTYDGADAGMASLVSSTSVPGSTSLASFFPVGFAERILTVAEPGVGPSGFSTR